MYQKENYYDYVPDEVAQKIHEIIKEEVNANLKSDFAELNRLRQSDKEKQDKIYELQQEIKKTKEEYDNKLKTALLKKQKEIQRKIFQGFTLKDKVYFIVDSYEYVPCPTCTDGKVKVMLNDKEIEVECPDCNCNGKNSIWKAYVRKGEITQVNFKTWNDESEKCTESSFWIKSDKGNNIEVNVDDIFLTEEEASMACELRNSKKD